MGWLMLSVRILCEISFLVACMEMRLRTLPNAFECFEARFVLLVSSTVSRVVTLLASQSVGTLTSGSGLRRAASSFEAHSKSVALWAVSSDVANLGASCVILISGKGFLGGV